MSDDQVQGAPGLATAGRELRAARDELRISVYRAKQAALSALAEGATEVDVAKALGVNRLTVRDWQGKNRRAALTTEQDR